MSAESEDLRNRVSELHAKAEQANEKLVIEQDQESLKLAHQLSLKGMTHAQAQIQRMLAAPFSPQKPSTSNAMEVKNLKSENEDLKRQIEELQCQLQSKEATLQVSIAPAAFEPAPVQELQATPINEPGSIQAEFSPPAETKFPQDTYSFQ